MSLVMTLLVRDEEDVLDANMRYHLEQGVDHIIVTDNLSVDGTADIIDGYVRQGVATNIHEPDNKFAQSKWVSRMARMAYDKQARWVIHCDADEFWMTDGGETLDRYFGRRRLSNVVRAPRHDLVCLENDGEPFWHRMVWRKTQSLNPSGRPLPPKIAHRAHADAVVGMGNHKVTEIGRQRRYDKGLQILHYPLRSREQYERKIRLGGQALANNPDLPEHLGGTWRRQFTELQDTGRLAYVEENVVGTDGLEAMKAAGEVIKDTRLRDYFTEKGE
ncbi:glycosyltransferase family 2 protein [Octadecabacter sp. CECT 8868]|uniref:glycosyltransferase family 2 protein n=1 Tax=Octadecabacter algicola TaxID=2909342 RepID=UPI001F172D9B|nr:glycosyltransferase family 2 protein [Octadecabacter algicola]MCF2906663.1 glycosyltransferase family 2 protein [Octadecabacter algicola]